jgi:hypothetical protein
MRSTLRAAATLVCASLTACAASLPSFQAGAPIEVERKALGPELKQGGKAVDPRSVLAGLEQLEATRADAQSAKRWGTGGAVLGAAGGVAVGYGVVTGIDGDGSGWAIAAVGAGVTAIALYVGHHADGQLLRAVDTYNATLSPASRTPTASISPWLGRIRTAEDRGIAGGVIVTF